jgi:hemin uptake protein HemP
VRRVRAASLDEPSRLHGPPCVSLDSTRVARLSTRLRAPQHVKRRPAMPRKLIRPRQTAFPKTGFPCSRVRQNAGFATSFRTLASAATSLFGPATQLVLVAACRLQPRPNGKLSTAPPPPCGNKSTPLKRIPCRVRMNSDPPERCTPPPNSPQGPSGGESDRPRILSSDELFQGRRELWIEHEGEMYRLRVTSRGRLYLTK